MKKLYILIITFQLSLLGYDYDLLLLQAQTSIFPKLIVLDKDLSQKTSNDILTMAIVYHPSDKRKSKLIKNMIENNFQDGLNNYKFKIILLSFDEVVNPKNSIDAYYILQGEGSSVKKVCSIAQKRSIPTFSYDVKNFDDDILISLAIYHKSYIYLNKDLVKKYNINFVDAFYQIVKISDE